MKIITTALAVLTAISTLAQTTITGQIKNASPGVKVTINVPFSNWLYDDNAVNAVPANNGSFAIKANIAQPQFIILIYGDIRIKLYAEPAKQITVLFDAHNYAKTLIVNGGLAAENAVCHKTGISFFSLYPLSYDSTSSPAQILAGLKKAQAASLTILHQAGDKITPAFLKIAEAEITYFAAVKLFDESFADHAWDTRPPTPPRFALPAWKKAIAAAYDDAPITNNNAVNSYNYITAINNFPFFVQRRYDTKEELVPLAEKIMALPFADIKQQLRSKGKSYFDFKVLTYYLQGIALQKALACFIDREIHQGELECIDEAYSYFTGHFAGSDYEAYVKKIMSPYLLAKGAAGTSGFNFITDTSLTFSKAVSFFKGSVLFVDLWGTWCPACRSEMTYMHALKETYNGRPVAFMYIAVEHNTNPEENWKKTARFFNIAGTHILANKNIQQYINEMYKDTLAFPSYILIDKNGNIVNTNAAYPSTGKQLYDQIDALL